jgi:hypothetical protein
MAPNIHRQIVGHWQHGGIDMKTLVRQAIDRLKEAA